ncbi:MAG: hydroxymethylbilane synthase [Nitrospirae bacterium]|nr:hydroxymethylbilane synthase [Nitrospirota bacterium]
MTEKKEIVIGTRGSKLALWQAEWVKAEINKHFPEIVIKLRKIKTTGDKILDVPLAKVGGKGLFVKEIEEAMLRGEIDIAVHSMKDVPTELPEGLHLGAICEREDPRDAFISRLSNGGFQIKSFKDLPQGATVGTSSLRRSCQLKHIRPDLQILQLRGNVDTRLRKLDEGQFDAIILASAGVKRLGHEDRITEYLPTNISLPAIGQGAIGIECREDDVFINEVISRLNHRETAICVRAERAFLKHLEGGCQVPIAAHAVLDGNILKLDGLVGSLEGDRIIRDQLEGAPENAEPLGVELAEMILSRGGKEILDEVYGNG